MTRPKSTAPKRDTDARRPASWWWLVVLMLLGPSCTFEPSIGPVSRCETTDDCVGRDVCVAGRCQDPTRPLPDPDMSTDDRTDLEATRCAIDRDRDGFFDGQNCPEDERDCDDSDPEIYPGAPRRCNDRDNDCDGEVDRRGCSCLDGQTAPCGTDEGICTTGMRTCDGGVWGACSGQGPEPGESCNGRDDDCDGLVDEDVAGSGSACTTGLGGRCDPGVEVCRDGELVCEASASEPESCNGRDDDCDGLVDEAPSGRVLVESCGASCPNSTVRLCRKGQWSACEPAVTEICDGADTNCDTRIDNQAPCLLACPDGVVVTGTSTCEAGAARCEPPEELCDDGRDNDCDGLVDEGCAGPSAITSMVYIPGGTFRMGARTGEQFSQVDERPERIVELDPYYIDRTEVSRADYKTCLDAGACPALEAPCAEVVASGEDADRPVGCMNYARADAYCNWRNRRLPTEAEWEKAARGPFPRYVIWPWGDNVDFEVTVMACFFGPEYCLQPVDSYLDGASFYGVLHMAGNRAELVEDFYDADVYDGPNVVVSPLQSDNLGEGRVVRGGSFGQRLRYGRTANRAAETFGSIDPVDVGFRCALDAP